MKKTEAFMPPSTTKPLKLDFNLGIKVLLFGLAVFLSVSIKSVFLSFGFFAFLIFWDKKFIIPSILISPPIETLLIATEGLTITKLLAALLIIYFIFHSYNNKTFYLDKNIKWLFIFLVLTLFGTIIGLYSLSPEMYFQSIFYNLNAVYPKIIFAYFLYNFLKIKGITFFIDSILFTTYALTLALIIFLLYFILFLSSEMQWYDLTRLTFEGADPNEFAGMILAIGSFSFYLVFSKNSKYETILGVTAIGLLIYAVFLTLSRGAILTLSFLLIIVFISYFKQSFKKTFFAGMLIILIFLIFLNTGLINIEEISERFMIGTDAEASSITAGRTDLFGAAIRAFVKKPFFGYGNTPLTAGMVTYPEVGRFASIHNIYLEILVRFGITGLLVFLILIWKATKGYFQFLMVPTEKKPKLLLILPIIALLVILFMGMSLSWQWRDIMWYLIGISMASTHFIKAPSEHKGWFN